MSLANQKHFLQLGSKRSSSSGNSLCGNISTSPRLRQVVWYWTGRSYPGAQARSFCHPQPVWEGEIFLLGFKEDSLDLKLGCAVEDEIGRPDPNEPDGDGRCQSQRTAVSNQVKKYFLLSEAWCNCKIWTDWERITFPSSTSPPSRNLSRYRSHNPQYIGYPEYMKSKFNL